MAGAKNHQYHILPPSIWPLIAAASALTFTSGMVLFMHDLAAWHIVLGLGASLITAGIACLAFAAFIRSGIMPNG